jgi:hypothetical protein
MVHGVTEGAGGQVYKMNFELFFFLLLLVFFE